MMMMMMMFNTSTCQTAVHTQS